MSIITSVVVDKKRVRQDSYRAFVRLMGIVTGTFRCRVLPSDFRVMYLPGGYWDAEAKKVREPLAILRDGRFVNKDVKKSIHALAQLWWAVHVRGEEAKEREHLLPLVPFVDKGWTQETTIFVRPLSYVPREKAEAEGRPWDAGSAQVVLRDGNDEIQVRIYIRRRENGLEATLPKWVISKKDVDKRGNEVDLKKYYSKLHFNAGGGNIDGSVLAATALLWAWYFRVPEPLLDREGKCATCRFLTWQPEDKDLWDKDYPIACRWFCTRRIMYIDEDYANSEEARILYWRGLEEQVVRFLNQARFEIGCDLWESSVFAGFGSLIVKGRSKIYERPVVNGRLDDAVKRLKEPIVYFDAPGFHDPEIPSASIPDVRIWVCPLLEGAPKRDYWRGESAPSPSSTNQDTTGEGKNHSSAVLNKTSNTKTIIENELKSNISATACFTGHRPQKLGGFNENNPIAQRVKKILFEVIEEVSEKLGIEYFISGGALGVDQWAAEEVIRRGSKLVIARPFPSQDRMWPEDARKRYAKIINRAYSVVDVSNDPYSREKMEIRNRWMVDNSSIVIAVWDGSGGGTGNCVKYAKEKNKLIIIINPKTGEIQRSVPF